MGTSADFGISIVIVGVPLCISFFSSCSPLPSGIKVIAALLVNLYFELLFFIGIEKVGFAVFRNSVERIITSKTLLLSTL